MIKTINPDDADAEKAEFFVCARDRGQRDKVFADNQSGICAHCGHPIYFRPYAPKRPTKICIECAVDLARAHNKPMQ
jgi:hypothetical protein